MMSSTQQADCVMNKIFLQICAALGMTVVLATLTTTVIGAPAAESSPVVPSDAEIRKILTERIGSHGNEIGIVVGVIEPQGRRFISYGQRNAGDARPLDGDTVFEIGSMTKVFTALLLADMVVKGEVALSDAAARYLPPDVEVPERKDRSITLIDLATHTSGLPFMPQNAPPLNDPAAAKYSAADLKHYVAGYQLTRDIGAEWEYSNIGYWVLSEALACRTGKSYGDLVRTRLLAPLKMANTDFALSPKMKMNLAVGHDAALQPAPVVSALGIYSIMPAAGALYSTVNDLSMVLSVAMGYERSPLAMAIEATVNTRLPASGGNEQALGWTVIRKGDDQIVFRDGGTYGYASSMAYDPEKRIGIIVLANQVGSVDDIARHLLRPDFPLAKPANTKHSEIRLEANLLDSYVGRYEAMGEGIFTVARELDFLTIESPADWGLPKLRIRPESPQDFFAAELPLRVTFKIDSNKRVTGLLIYPPRGQKAVPANKLAADK
jgi:serine-type D-Ala-D-Ala carboxypeptidase/endopeptidase